MSGTVICSNCGKKISFIGNVCPYCHADKTKDKETTAIIALIVIGFFIWLIYF